MNKNLHPTIKRELKNLYKIKDRLGMPIDKKIALLVSILKTLEFVTTSSCSGHKGRSYPYVDISSKLSEKLESSEELKQISELLNVEPYNELYLNQYNKLVTKPLKNNQKEGRRLLKLLNEFYLKRNVNAMTRIVIEEIGGGIGGYRLYPQGSLFIDLMPSNERSKWLRLAQIEMNDFAYFLCDKVK